MKRRARSGVTAGGMERVSSIKHDLHPKVFRDSGGCETTASVHPASTSIRKSGRIRKKLVFVIAVMEPTNGPKANSKFNSAYVDCFRGYPSVTVTKTWLAGGLAGWLVGLRTGAG